MRSCNGSRVKEAKSAFTGIEIGYMLIDFCRCGGPKLVKFAGDSSNLSPKARILTILGCVRN